MSRKRHETEDDHRRRLLEGLSGRVIEVGAGNGLNFALYPAAVEAVLAVEPEPLLRKAAIEEARSARHRRGGRRSCLRPSGRGWLPGRRGRLAGPVLVPDQVKALAEMRRVVKPGGELRFYEHVVAHRPIPARLQRIADATFWPRVAGGCHMARETQASIETAGFEVERIDRFGFTPGAPIPHILGLRAGPDRTASANAQVSSARPAAEGPHLWRR